MDKPKNSTQNVLSIDTNKKGESIQKSLSQPSPKTSPKKTLASLIPRSLSQSLPSLRQKNTSFQEIKSSSCIEDNTLIIKESPVLSIIINNDTYICLPLHHLWLRDPNSIPTRNSSVKISTNSKKPLIMLYNIVELPKYNFYSCKSFRVNHTQLDRQNDHYQLDPTIDNSLLDLISKDSQKWLHIEYVDSVIFGKSDLQPIVLSVHDRFCDLHKTIYTMLS